MIKKIYQVISLFILTIFLSSWGAKGHYTINNKCPESFPASMAAFRVWADSLDIHGSDADNRKNSDPTESPKHFIDIDTYPEFNSTGRIASTYDSIVTAHGSCYVIKNGTLPWATVNMYDTLRSDFQKLRWHKAMLDASDLGHYVGDGHMPLHLATNYDGQLTGQGGVHSRYETAMVGYYLTELSNYTGEEVHFVSHVNKYVFDYIYFNYQYKDSVLAADTYARNLAGKTSSTAYYAALWSQIKVTTMIFQHTSHSLAELIYSAWVEAGSPAFGATTLSAVENTEASNISVYPNPTSGTLHITGDHVYKTEISSITGSTLGIFYDKQVDVSRLSDGMYILGIYGKEGLLKREKILVTKK